MDLMVLPGTGPDILSAKRACVAIAANPYSGSGPTRKRVAELACALDRLGIESRIIWDRHERAAQLRRSEFPLGCRCVVAAGGDGTVADVINEMPSGVPFATLPSGNENLFAREFGFTKNSVVLAQTIAVGKTREIDLGSCGTRFFCLMLSVGFDAAVVHRVTSWRASTDKLRRVNRLSYAKPIADVLRSYTYPSVDVEADGVRVRGTHAFVFNLPQYGFQLPFAPDARVDDGMLDWLVFERPGLGGMLSYFWSLVRSKHLMRADVHYGLARRLRISGPIPVPVQMDGDPGGFTPIDVNAVTRALRVVVA